VKVFDIFKRKEHAKPVRDISEPITTVLGLMRSEPGRFDLLPVKVEETKSESFPKRTRYGVRDRKLRTEFYWFEYEDIIGCIPSIGITGDEAKAMRREAWRIYRSRKEAWSSARHKARRDIIARAYPLYALEVTR
jgi:hypothetical protein